MGINTDRTPQNGIASRRVDEPRDKQKHDLKTEQVDRFRALLQAKSSREETHVLRKGTLKDGDLSKGNAAPTTAPDRSDAQTEGAVLRRSGRQDERFSGGQEQEADVLKPAELAALYQAQLVMREVHVPPPNAAPVAHANPQKLADLLERHVRQLAVGSGGAASDKEILLRLTDSTLPGTDLMLTKTASGWKLNGQIRSLDSYLALQDAGPRLAERFAERSLGVLEIEWHRAT